MKRGSVLMEFVLTMPIMIVLLMLVLQFGLVWIAREQTAYAAYCAARSSLSYAPIDQPAAANNAAYLALAWVHGASAGGILLSIPGWGTIPNSGGMDKWVSVDLGNARGQNKQGRCVATVTYDYPLGVPVAARLISAINSRMKTDITLVGIQADEAKKNGHYYITLTETCVLPIPYSCANLPKGGLL